MATAKQIAANRRNAQKSCGPKSPEMKAKVSQNALKHGLCAKFRVIGEAENQESFDLFLNQLMQDEQPVGQAEIELVVKMAEYTWLSKRALYMQSMCFVLEAKTPEQKRSGQIPVGIDPDLERFVRYQAAQDRAYQRASAELIRRKKERRLAEIGFASQKRAEAQEQRRENAEQRKAECHHYKIENEKQRLERQKGANFLQAAKVSGELERILPPEVFRSIA